MINTVNSKTFTIQNTLLDSFTYSENISLIIPSISFSKTFDNNSTLKNNLELEKSSVMPNKENSTVIILGHSGYNFNAYFNDLFVLIIIEGSKCTYLSDSDIFSDQSLFRSRM